MDIIASGPHNSNKIKLNVLNGMAPPPSRAIVASFRGLGNCGCGCAGTCPASRMQGLGESVYKSGLEDSFSWPFFIGVIAVLGFMAYRDLR